MPSVVVKAGSVEDGSAFANSSASVCLTSNPDICYVPPVRDNDYFYGFDPRARVVRSQRDYLILFDARGGGGSGFAYNVALLRERHSPEQHFQNLLPSMELSNLDEWQAQTMSEVSPYPLFLVAQCEWIGMESHYSPHRYKVVVYIYDPSKQIYKRLTSYETRAQYPSNKEDQVSVIKPELRNIMRHLSRGATGSSSTQSNR